MWRRGGGGKIGKKESERKKRKKNFKLILKVVDRKAQTCFSDIVISTIEAFVARLSKEYFQKKKLDCHKCSFVPMIDYVEDYVDSEYIQKLRFF